MQFLGLPVGADYDLVKATLQSLAYQTRDVVDTMQQDADIKIPTLRVDGGASNNNYLMQFQADILGIEIERTRIAETTGLGVAFMAGLAVGFWRDVSELKEIFVIGKSFAPQMNLSHRECLYQGWKRAVLATRVFCTWQVIIA